jgi:hypothetical protein
MRRLFSASSLVALISVAPAATAQESAGGSTIEKCERPLAVLAVREPQNESMSQLSAYKLGAPGALIRMFVQESNCFVVVDRGQGIEMSREEREHERRGELQPGSNVGARMVKSPDYFLVPSVQFVDGNRGGLLLSTLTSRLPFSIGGLGVRFKEAETNMFLTDARTSVQVAAAEGKASRTSFALGGAWLPGIVGGVAGAYSNTNEGKLVAASLLDTFNKLVRAVRSNPQSIQAAEPVVGLSGTQVKAGAFAEGDVLLPKLAKVPVLASPSGTGRVVATLTKNDEAVFLGEEQEEFVRVASAGGEGWVRRSLVRRVP